MGSTDVISNTARWPTAAPLGHVSGGREPAGQAPGGPLQLRLQLSPEAQEARLPLPAVVDAGQAPIGQLVAEVEGQGAVVTRHGVVAGRRAVRQVVRLV